MPRLLKFIRPAIMELSHKINNDYLGAKAIDFSIGVMKDGRTLLIDLPCY